MKTLLRFGALAAIGIHCTAQEFTSIHDFDDSADGNQAQESLVLDGEMLYGTTPYSRGGCGVLFKVRTDGTGFAVLHAEGMPHWNEPKPVVVAGSTLYGVTYAGGPGDGTQHGSLFQVNTDGTGYAVLRYFANDDGAGPNGSLLIRGETLYGTTQGGGAFHAGTVYKIDTNGSGHTILYSFPAVANPNFWTNATGAGPSAGLALDGETLFGTTFGGGVNGNGTVFKMDTNGKNFAVLHVFGALVNSTNADGACSRAVLALRDGQLYGTTTGGGRFGYGTVFKVGTNGSDFTVFAALSSGPGIAEGVANGLTLVGDTLYGTSSGAGGHGQIYSLRTDGTGFRVLYECQSDSPTRAIYPDGAPACRDGALYGCVKFGGSYPYAGMVYRLRLTAPTPTVTSCALTNGSIAFTWNTSAGSQYQVQYAASPDAADWMNLGGSVTATNESTFLQDPVDQAQRFYRIVRLAPDTANVGLSRQLAPP